MSNVIDQKVVEMRFDNQQFERGVAQTVDSINKLNKSFDTSEINSYKSGLFSLKDTFLKTFSALEWKVANGLSKTIEDLANKMLGFKAMASGFSEYETKINSIQTIMSNTASKGTTMEDVTRVIGELNTYADKTIYNFAEMTRNIGTFTAAGIGLEESAAAIQGIANLAAASGSNSQQASTAMYQLSQALASGTVKLMDWNSVVNAGMGGEKFQEALKATAREHGVAVDDIIAKNGSFRNSLQEGWISADIMNETLRKFTVDGAKAYAQSMLDSGKYTQEQADALIKEAQAMEDAATKVKTFTQLMSTLEEAAQSGWSQTWEIIVGDFEEAKELLTHISDVVGGLIGKSSDARNALLEDWKTLGGRQDLVDSLWNVFDAIGAIAKPIKEAFEEIFPPITAKNLLAFTNGLKEFTAKLKLSDEAADKVRRTFKGIFAIFDVIGYVFSSVTKAIFSVTGSMGGLASGALDIVANFGDWLVALKDTIKDSDLLGKTIRGIATIVKGLISVATKLFNKLKDGFILPGVDFFHSMLEKLHSLLGKVSGAAEGMGDSVSSTFESIGNALSQSTLFKVLEAVWKAMLSIGSGIAKIFGAIGSRVIDMFANADFSRIIDFLNAFTMGGIAAGIYKFIGGFTGILDTVSGIGEGFSGIIEGIGGALEGLQSALKADVIMKIAKAVLILAAAMLILYLIDEDKMASAITGITVLFAELMGTMAIFSKLAGGLKGVNKTAGIMTTVALAVLILAFALKKVSDLSWSELAVGLTGVAGLLAMVVAATKVLGSGKSVVKGAVQMILYAAAVKILASACKDLSTLSWEQLAKGLVGVGVLLAEISLFMNTAKFSFKAITTATGIVILAAALKILVSVCKDFARMEWGDIKQGLITIGLLLAEIAIFTNLAGKAKHVLSTGVALIAIAAALKIISSVMSDIAKMSWNDIQNGLTAMGLAMLELVIAMHLMPKDILGKAIGLIGVATALLILSNTLKSLGNMTWESVAKGLVALGGSLLILAVGLHAMNGTIGGTIALILATAALTILVPLLAILGAMSWSAIAKGLIAIAGAFVIIGAAGYVLAPIVPAILALSGAMFLIGAAVLVAGVGLMAFGAGLTALGVGLTALVGSLAAMPALIVSLVVSIVTGVIRGIGEGIIALCQVIIEGAPAIFEAAVVLITTFCQALVQTVPVIVETIFSLLVSVLQSLVSYTPTIVDLLFQFIIGIIDGIAANLPALIESVFGLLVSLFRGVVAALFAVDPAELLGGVAAVGLLAGILFGLAALAPLVPAAMVGVLGFGVLVAELALVLAAIGALAQIPGLSWLVGEGGSFLTMIADIIFGFIKSIVDGIAGVIDSLADIGASLSEFVTNLGGFIEGVKKVDASVVAGAGYLAAAILAIIGTSILSKLGSWLGSGNDLQEFANVIADVAKTFTKLSSINESTVSGFLSAMDALKKVNTESLIKSFEGFDKKLGDVATKAMDAFVKAITSKGPDLERTGKNSADKFANGLKSGVSSIIIVVNLLAVTALTAMYSKYNSFKSAGAYLVSGFASGISANSYKAAAKARAMAAEANQAARDELDINSPSRVLMETGASIPEGFAKGIDKMGGVVNASSRNMATVAVENVKSTIGKLADAVNTNIDAQPTIRPVLDLSEVRAGAGSISGLFGQGASIGVSANVGAISAMMAQRNQNGPNAEVISELKKLRRDFGGIKSDTYNINGITYDDGSGIQDAVKSLVRAAKMERRV